MRSGDWIRENGHEYGTVTGRPRRVGWFDSVVVRHARRVSGITGFRLTRWMCCPAWKRSKFVRAISYRGEVIEHYPASLKMLSECEAVYEEMPGWSEDITGVRRLERSAGEHATLCGARIRADGYSDCDLLRWP